MTWAPVRRIPEEQKSQLHRCKNLKVVVFIAFGGGVAVVVWFNNRLWNFIFVITIYYKVSLYVPQMELYS